MKKKASRQETEQGVKAGERGRGWRLLPGWLCLAAAAAVFYAPAMSGPFLFDDLNLPMLTPQADVLTWDFYVKRGLRAVTNLSLLLDKEVWGLNPAPYHATNLLLHLANGLLVWLILRKLVERAGGAAEEPGRVGALFGAGLFLLHPLQTEAVAYIASRSEVLCALFAYAACYVFLQAGEEGAGVGRTAAILALLGLGLVSKEPAVAMAGVLLLADVWFGEGLDWGRAWKNWKLYGAMALGGLGAGYRIYQIASREGTAGASAAVSRVDYLVTQWKAVWVYVRMIFVPVGQNLDHAYPVTKAPGDALAWLGLAGLAALVGGAFVWRRRYPLATLGVLTFLVLLAPTSSVVPIDDRLAERRVYLGFLGVAMVGVEFVWRLREAGWKKPALAGVLLVLGVLTMARSRDYGSAEAMWASSVSANPENGRARFQLAYVYYTQGRCGEAAAQYGEAAKYGKRDYRLLVDWALALECAGDTEGALEKLRAATGLERDSHAWSVMGMVLAKRNETAKALEALDKALEINPSDELAHVYKGNVYVMTGQREAALAEYDAALKLNPANEAALAGKRAAAGAGR
jgi:tetratricopeptide (TPR) repeat protein